MPTAVRETIQVLEMIVQAVPVGTNLGLLYMLWAMLRVCHEITVSIGLTRGKMV